MKNLNLLESNNSWIPGQARNDGIKTAHAKVSDLVQVVFNSDRRRTSVRWVSELDANCAEV